MMDINFLDNVQVIILICLEYEKNMIYVTNFVAKKLAVLRKGQP